MVDAEILENSLGFLNLRQSKCSNFRVMSMQISEEWRS